MNYYHDRGQTGCAVGFLIIWGLMLIGIAGFWGLVAWAIYRLVIHFTGGAA